jgi:hypothetical protein
MKHMAYIKIQNEKPINPKGIKAQQKYLVQEGVWNIHSAGYT